MHHNNLPSRRRLITPILLVSLWLSAGSPSAALPQSADNDALRSLVDRFLRAVQDRDLNTLRRLSSVKSPESSARNAELVKDFSAFGNVELADVVTRKLVILGDKAIIRAVATMKVANGGGSSGEKRLDLTFHCTKEGAEWRISTFLPSEDEFAKEVLAAPGEQRKSLLESNTELVTPALAAKLVSQGRVITNRGDFGRAVAAFRLAADVAELLGDKSGITLALNLAAGVHNEEGNYDAALELVGRSLVVASESGVEIQIANAKNALGRTYLLLDRDPEAETHLKSAIAIYEKYGDKSGLAAASNNLAMIHLSSGDYVQARSFLERAHLLAQETGERSELARALNYFGRLEVRLGNNAKALKYLEASLQIRQDIDEKPTIARTMTNIGVVNLMLGNRVAALDYYQRARALAEELGQKSDVALVLGNVAELYFAQGNHRQALEHYQASLQRYTELRNRRERARMLNNIGNIYALAGSHSEAVGYYNESLEVMKELGDKDSIAATLNNLAGVHNGLQEYEKALKAYEESLAIKRELGNKSEVARVLSNIAMVYLGLKNYAKALELATEAARQERDNAPSDIYQEAITRAGHAHRGLGDWNAAARSYQEAIDSIERGRKEVIGGAEDDQLFFEGSVNPYLSMVGTLVQQNKYLEALQYAERVQGRVLLDVLRSGKTNVTKAMTASEQIQERQFNQQLLSLNAERLSRQQAGDDQAKLAALEAEIRKARSDYESFHTVLYAAHPDLKMQRGEVEPFTIEDAASLIGNSNNAFLEYVVTEEETLLFVLTAARPGPLGEKQRSVDLRLYSIKVARPKLADLARRFRETISSRRAGFRELATELYALLLAPAREQIANSGGLIVTSVGGLRELPFQALQSPQGRYLIEDHAISYAPSFSVLREMRKGRHRKDRSSAPPMDLLAFGNPAIGRETTAKVKLVLMDETLEPLPQAEKQVRILASLYGARSKVYIGQEALEGRLKAEAGGSRILHLATHAILNDESPMYSQVILSKAAGDAEDGLLEAREIMNLNLNADLVVLSACETARGKVREGEGMVGLSWAIFVAGSPTIVASQWKVESASNTILMVDFHKNLLARTKKGGEQGSAEALRQAALKLRRTARYRHPFYWAPFIVVGDGN